MDDAAKLRKETEYKEEKMVVRKLIKKSKMHHYHEALKNARTNPKDTWHLLRQFVSRKSKRNKCNLQNPTISASTFNNFFYNVQRRQTEESDHWTYEYIGCGLRESLRCGAPNPYKRQMLY